MIDKEVIYRLSAIPPCASERNFWYNATDDFAFDIVSCQCCGSSAVQICADGCHGIILFFASEFV